MAINWRNVNAPNNASYLQQQAQAGQGVGNAFKEVGSLFTQAQASNDADATQTAVSNLQNLSADQLRNVNTNDPVVNAARNQLLTAAQNQANVDTGNQFRQDTLANNIAQQDLANTRADANLQLNQDRFGLERDRFNAKTTTNAQNNAVGSLQAAIQNASSTKEVNDITSSDAYKNLSGTAQAQVAQTANTSRAEFVKGQKLTNSDNKAYDAYAERGRTGITSYNEAVTLHNQANDIDPKSGFAGTATETLKTLFGSQDAATAWRTKVTGLRQGTALKSLPPGPASDKDIALVLAGVPDKFSNPVHLQGYLRGVAKAAALSNAHDQFAQDYIESNRSRLGINKAWTEYIEDKQNSDAILNQVNNDFNAAPANGVNAGSGGAPAVGTVATNANGARLIWNGQGWVK